MARNWFAYNGAGSDLIPGNYTAAVLPPDQFCEGGSITCAIYTYGEESSPTRLTQNIKNYLIIAKATRTYYPTMDKPYVYTRPA